ncbi:MAG: hypothetical protein U0797_21390 [Gemmataceae bacterium]
MAVPSGLGREHPHVLQCGHGRAYDHADRLDRRALAGKSSALARVQAHLERTA